MWRASHARHTRGRSLWRAAAAGTIIAALLGALTVDLARAADPDFSSVADILGGQRYLLRDDDLVVGQITGFRRDLLLTTRLQIASQNLAPVVGTPCNGQIPRPAPLQTRAGRLFNLDHDVVVTLAPLSAAGPGCTGSPNLGFYIQDPHDPANNSLTSITVSPTTTQIVLADFDGDGHADIFLLDDQVAVVYTAVDPHNPAQGLTEVGRLSTGAKLAPQDTPVTGDFNGDGALDVAWPTAVMDDGIGTDWTVAFASVCPAANAVVLGRTCARAFQIVLSSRSITVGAASAIVPSVALTAGNYAGAIAGTGVPSSQLVIAWNSLDNTTLDFLAVYSFDSMLAPTLRSTASIPYGPNTGFFSFDQPLVASGRLGWFGSSDQVVFTSTQTGVVSVIAFDQNLVMTPHSIRFPDGNLDPSLTNFSVGLAVGRFDPPDVNGARNPNLQIARLAMMQNSLTGAARVFLEIYTVDPASGFTAALASSSVLADEAWFPVDGDTLLPRRYGNPLGAGDLQARSLALGPPQKITVTGNLQPQVVLGLPPMHIDFIQDATHVPGGAPAVLNITARPSKYFSQYQTQQSASNQSANTSTTSYTVATKESASAKFSYGVPDVASVSADVKAGAQQTHNNSVATKYNTYSSQQFDVSTQTGFSDLVWFTAKRFNIYAYRVLGQCVPATGSPASEGCPAGTQPLYVQFSGPDLVTQSRIDGNLLEWYQPVHEPGNVFSYPWSAALLRDLYPGFSPLTADPATVWSTDSSGSTVSASWSQSSGSSVTSGSVATQSLDVSTTVSASAKAAGFGASGSASFDYSTSRSVSTLNESSSTLGSSTGIKIVKPAFVNPGQYAYAAQTYIFGQDAPAGTVQQIPLSTAVKSAGPLWTAFVADPTAIGDGAGAWWAQAYTRPDVALNHPLRWTWTPPSPTAGDVLTFNDANPGNPADSEFYFMKGLYITPAGADGQGSQIVQATAGDAIRLQARVYNYSLADMPNGSTVHVRFYGQEWDNAAHDFTGAAFVIGEVMLDPIPGFNSPTGGGQEPNWALASTTLDTTSHADSYLVFWVVVWMEQNGALVSEPAGHGLTSLPRPTTAPTALAIERYSNNVGFYNQPFFVCPKPCPQPSAQVGALAAASLSVEKVKIAPSRIDTFQKATVSASLLADHSGLDGVVVVFYDGDPQRGGEAFDAELIPHIRAGEPYVTRVPFRPRTCGTHTVFVVAQGTATGSATVAVDCAPDASGKFSGKAERVGVATDDGKMSFSATVPGVEPLDLRSATVTVRSLLQDIGGELVRGGAGKPFLPLTLVAGRGSKATEAIFETPAGMRPSVRIEVKQRDPRKGDVELSVKVERATIPLAPKGCDPRVGNTVRLGTSIAIGNGGQGSLEVNPTLSWRCGKNELKTP